jgi:putative Mg2+ transporter-C (MgtC) family protein
MHMEQAIWEWPEGAVVLRMAVRLIAAALLGGVIGYERESLGKAAGLRTHMLVSLGAALFVLAPLEGGMAMADASRVIQGITTGIGFIGAGAILKRDSERDVRGLTTAASVWLTAAVGVAAGMGRLLLALLAVLLALVILRLLWRVEPGSSQQPQS